MRAKPNSAVLAEFPMKQSFRSEMWEGGVLDRADWEFYFLKIIKAKSKK